MATIINGRFCCLSSVSLCLYPAWRDSRWQPSRRRPSAVAPWPTAAASARVPHRVQLQRPGPAGSTAPVGRQTRRSTAVLRLGFGDADRRTDRRGLDRLQAETRAPVPWRGARQSLAAAMACKLSISENVVGSERAPTFSEQPSARLAPDGHLHASSLAAIAQSASAATAARQLTATCSGGEPPVLLAYQPNSLFVQP